MSLSILKSWMPNTVSRALSYIPMPLLGLFKRQKGKGELSPSIASNFSSPTTEYLPDDKQLPSSPNGGANSSKLHLPFRRKKTSEPASIVSHATVGSEADLRPPIRAYADVNGALSTRSLPPNTPRRPTFFKWPSSKTHLNAKPLESPPPPLPSPPKIEYRPPPPVRPRGASVASAASDSSQRISVAAFREAQAKRSLAGSPVPSLRAPSPGPSSFARSTTPRMRVSALATDSDSDESSDANESDDQSRLGRRNTVTHRKNPSLTDPKPRAARSELGHSARPPGKYAFSALTPMTNITRCRSSIVFFFVFVWG